MKMPSLFRSFSLIAAVTVFSKILGLVRDQMITHAYGASIISDAYLYAFQIPAFALILLGGLGGPFHTATVAVLSKLLKGDEKPTETAQKITHTFITLTGIAFALLAAAAFVAAPAIIELIANQASSEMKALAVHQLQWMSPLILIGGIIGIFYGVANVYHRFFWSSISPSAVNVVLIVWLFFLGADATGHVLAVSTLMGGVLQLLIQLPDFLRAGFTYRPAFHVSLPEMKTLGELLFPAMVGTTIGQVNIYVAMFFVSQLAEGGWTAIVLGNRLVQLPIGVLTIAMLVPLFPRFSRWVGEKDFDALRHSFREGILSLWLLSLPVVALIFLVAKPSVSLLFQRGAFDDHDAWRVAVVLMMLSLSILPYMLRDGVTRVFYAFDDSKTPLVVGLVSIGINFVANALLVGPLGVRGIALSTVIVTISNAFLLSLLIRKHIRDLGIRRLIGPGLKMSVAALAAYGVGLYWLSWLSEQLHVVPAGSGQQLAQILTTLVVVAVVYFPLLLVLKITLAQRLFDRVRQALLK